MAERLLLQALEDQRPEHRISLRQTRAQAAARRLEFELLRFLRHEAAQDTLFEPEHLESPSATATRPSRSSSGINVRGRIDRVDVWDGYALVRDYKTGRSVDRYKVASWRAERVLQAPLYMMALRHLLPDKKVAGGVYTPLGGDKRTSARAGRRGVQAGAGERLRSQRLAARGRVRRAHRCRARRA